MRVTDIWLIYVLVVLGIYLLLTFANCRLQWEMSIRLLVSFVIGLLVILFLIPNINPMNNTDRTLYTLLLILSFGLPILLGLWVAWKRKMIPGLKATDPETDEEGYQTKKEFKCDDNGCHLAKVTRVRPGEKENYLYQ